MKAHPALFGGVGRGGRGSQKKEALLPSKHSWRFIHYPAITLLEVFIRWSDVSPTTNIRHGILVVFANRPPVGPTTPVRRGGLLVGPTTPVRRGGPLVGPSLLWRPTQLYLGGQGRVRRGWAKKNEALLPSKHSWRFIHYPANTLGGLYVGPLVRPPYKAWDIGGFCKSATGGTDHAGPTWGFIGGSDHAGPTWGFIGGSNCLLWRPTQLYLGESGGSQGGGEPKKRRHYYSSQTLLEVYTFKTLSKHSWRRLYVGRTLVRTIARNKKHGIKTQNIRFDAKVGHRWDRPRQENVAHFTVFPWGLLGGSKCLLWRPTQLYLGESGEGSWAGSTITQRQTILWGKNTLVRPPI